MAVDYSIFDNKVFIIIVSMLWGIGLALLIRKECTLDSCVIKKVPVEVLENSVIQDSKTGYKYKLHKQYTECDLRKEEVKKL